MHVIYSFLRDSLVKFVEWVAIFFIYRRNHLSEVKSVGKDHQLACGRGRA